MLAITFPHNPLLIYQHPETIVFQSFFQEVLASSKCLQHVQCIKAPSFPFSSQFSSYISLCDFHFTVQFQNLLLKTRLTVIAVAYLNFLNIFSDGIGDARWLLCSEQQTKHNTIKSKELNLYTTFGNTKR